MKILWHSNAPWVGTGYGSQTNLFVPRIRDLGHDVAISAFYGLHGAPQNWDGIRIYPADDAYGSRWVTLMTHEMADGGDPRDVLVLTLMDVWVLLNGPHWPQLKVASWVPVDHLPTPLKVVDFFKKTGAVPIAMSRFGEQQLQLSGLDPLYVPHGVDTKLMAPKGREQGRQVISQGPLKVPDDAFVVGMVAANTSSHPPRKAFPQAFMAFAELRRRHPEALLYLHAELTAGPFGVDLRELAIATGVPLDSLRYTPPWMLFKGIEYEHMSWIYSAFDVLLQPSYGEGFGIPILEAQTCGVPVIVNDFSAMPELCGSGWKVGGEPYYDPSQGAFFQSPSVPELVEALEDAYQAKATARGDELQNQALEFAAGYDADTIADAIWRPTLEKVRFRLLEQPVPPVRFQNRQQRRAKRPAKT